MGREGDQDAIDDHMDADEDVAGDDETEIECGLMANGQCSMAGTEHCDWTCPNSVSAAFVGSAAWREAQGRRKR